MVLKPVRTAMANATASSSWPSCGRLARTILVPLNKKCLATSAMIELSFRSRRSNDSFVAGTLETGTDSPALLYQHRLRETLDVLTGQHALIDDAVTR